MTIRRSCGHWGSHYICDRLSCAGWDSCSFLNLLIRVAELGSPSLEPTLPIRVDAVWNAGQVTWPEWWVVRPSTCVLASSHSLTLVHKWRGPGPSGLHNKASVAVRPQCGLHCLLALTDNPLQIRSRHPQCPVLIADCGLSDWWCILSYFYASIKFQ